MFYVTASVSGGTDIGEVEATSAEEAIAKAARMGDVSLCHQCARKVSDLEIDEMYAEPL